MCDATDVIDPAEKTLADRLRAATEPVRMDFMAEGRTDKEFASYLDDLFAPVVELLNARRTRSVQSTQPPVDPPA